LRQPDAARLSPRLEGLADHRHDLVGEEAASCAAMARAKLRAAKRSTSSRVMPYCLARFSAVSPMVTQAAGS
jgi:hypothetical protein